jgi:hypothetical protein
MPKFITAAAAAALLAAIGQADHAALAQGLPQPLAIVKVDPQTIGTGYRASKVSGSTVVNDHNETIGKIDDLIISQDGSKPFAVLSVGGFLGMGEHLVAVPYNMLKIDGDRLVLPGATKDELKTLPEFRYAARK